MKEIKKGKTLINFFVVIVLLMFSCEGLNDRLVVETKVKTNVEKYLSENSIFSSSLKILQYSDFKLYKNDKREIEFCEINCSYSLQNKLYEVKINNHTFKLDSNLYVIDILKQETSIAKKWNNEYGR